MPNYASIAALASDLSDEAAFTGAFVGQYATVDRPAAADHNGKILWDVTLMAFYESNGSAWSEVALGGGGAVALPLDTYASVGSGDEFTGSSLDAAWSTFGSVMTTTVSDGALLINNASGSLGDTDHGIYKTFSPAGDFEVIAKLLGLSAIENYQWAGLMVGGSNPANDRVQQRVAMTIGSGSLTLHTLKRVSGSWTDVHASPNWVGVRGNLPMWLRIKRAGTTISFGQSIDGHVWYDHPSTTTISFTVATLGLFIGSSTTTIRTYGLFDYVRTA